MIANKKILVIIPARGGSKGIHKKNLVCIDGVPLVGLAARVAKSIPEIDRILVSTDDDQIAMVAETYGAAAPFRRPPELSGDRVGDWDVLHHALTQCEKLDSTIYDVIVMLQPTSPLRRVEDVLGTINMLISSNYDSVWSVSETDSKSHPLKQLKIADNRLYYWDDRGRDIVARQQLDRVYHRNGVAYAITRQCLLEQRSCLGSKSGAYVINHETVSIDTEWDLALVSFISSRKVKS